MANPSKRRGTAWETSVVTFLQQHGFPYAERRALRGTDDRGDVAGVVGWTLECKAERSIDLAGACNEASAEAVNAGTHWWAAIVKRRNRPTCDAYVVMSLAQFAELLADPEALPEEAA